VPTTAIVDPLPCSAPSCAAPSMPSASPDTMQTPARDRLAAKLAALALPWLVALRAPTIASAGRASNSRRPLI